MSKRKNNPLPAHLERIMKQNAAAAISTEEGLLIAEQFAEIADVQGVEHALCGGIAVNLYGFTRATKDVDFLADELLDLEAERELSFGGESYSYDLGRRVVPVDWIVRNDEQQAVYQSALEDAVSLGSLRVITPEWLVIIKQLVGRGKDELDLLWLLRRDGLVDRDLVEEHIREIFGKNAYWALQDLEAVYLEADLMKAKDERFE